MSQAKRANGANDAVDSDNPAEGNVDKIRDILFGGQMREYERRFERIEAEFTRKLTQLENDERYLMGTWLCSNVTSRMRARMFAAKQTYFEEMLSQKDVAREA